MKTTAIQLMLLLLLMAAASACTKANPDACCENNAQCIALGVPADEHRACENGQTCSPVTLACVAPECTANTDCDPKTPVCSNRICIAACHTADDCTADAATPLCQTETGTCVGCLDASTCGGDTPYCDASTHACRGCAVDAECPSGVCIEADGICAKSEQLLYVSSAGADVGDCVSAPCGSLAFALGKVDDYRNIIRTAGASLDDSSMIVFRRAVTIDGDGTTTFRTPTNTSTFEFSMPLSGVVTLEGVKLLSIGDRARAIVVGNGDSLRLHDVVIDNSRVYVQGSLFANAIAGSMSDLECAGGSLTMINSTFDAAGIDTQNCATTVKGNRFEPPGQFYIAGGLLSILNNVFIVDYEFQDLLRLYATTPGSVVAFNTIVNTSTVVESGVAIACDASVVVTSNIIAYNSTNPINGDGCVARHSLFDLQAPDDVAAHASNMATAPSTFFRNAPQHDFHLASGSPALGLGEAGIATVDLEGNPRPQPSKTTPDAGAYEAR